MAKEDDDWTQEEIDASVKVYLEMLSKEKANEKYNKTEHRNRLLAGDLNGRSRPAFEFRMRNISFVLDILGYQYIRGYKPAKNVGPNPTSSILRSLERIQYLEPSDLEPTPEAEQIQERTERIRKRINVDKKPAGQRRAKQTTASTTIYFRDPAVRAWVLENAKGKCEACDMDAPFILPDGYPFLEVHHMIPLASNGPDTVENAVALCPNCHRRTHLSKERDSFNKVIYSKVLRLIQ